MTPHSRYDSATRSKEPGSQHLGAAILVLDQVIFILKVCYNNENFNTVGKQEEYVSAKHLCVANNKFS